MLSEVTSTPAWTVADAAATGGPSLHSRLLHRTMDLRTPANRAVFAVQARVCRYMREYLDARGFVEVHTAKLQPAAAAEGAGGGAGGSGVFKVDYFGRAAYLAQSPQLAKEMCMAADFERVYEIGPGEWRALRGWLSC